MGYRTPPQIAGYTYQAENYSPDDMLNLLIESIPANIEDAQHYAYGFNTETEELLNEWADNVGVNREDERSFDSGDFPKVIWEDQLTCSDLDWTNEAPKHDYWPDASTYGAVCGNCGNEL
jgi:hypothetical protein